MLKLWLESCDEDTRFGKLLREEPVGEKALYAAQNDTTSELPVGNDRSGTPVTESMSDSVSCNQGGTVEYFVSHP